MRPCKHAAARVAAEIGLDQRLGDARKRHGLDRKPEERGQPLQGGDLVFAEAIRPDRSSRRNRSCPSRRSPPSAAKRLSIATNSVIAATRKSANIGNSSSPSAGMRRRSSELSVLQHSKPRARAPALGGLPFGAAAVFGQRRLRLLALPAESPPLMDGMKRVDEHDRARERQPRGDDALAEALDENGFRPSFEADLGEPARQFDNLRLCHGSNHSA